MQLKGMIKGDDLIVSAMKNQYRKIILLNEGQVVHGITDQKGGESISDCKGADAGECGYQDHGGGWPDP